MAFNLSSLLIHSDDVPPGAKQALCKASRAPAALREPLLAAAARSLFLEVGLSCDDARELVGLPAGRCG